MDLSLARQIASFIGALMILFAYAGHQMKRMDARKASYNILNAVGSAILAYIALHPSASALSCWKSRGQSSVFTHWCGSGPMDNL